MIKIDSMDHNGRGIAKLNNKIVFVENALPGEIVEIKVDKEKKNFTEARVSRYIKKSENREKIICPYFDICGGCNLLHLNYENQLKFKQDKISNIAKKYLNTNVKINNIVESNNQFYYRNKITFHVKNNKIGFFKNKTNKIIQINKCFLANNIINSSINYLKLLDLKHINKIICRVANNKLMIIIETKNKNINIDCIKEVAHSIYLKYNNIYYLVYGQKYITETINNYNFLISPDSFFQINLDVCKKLYDKINNYIGFQKNILDLYCGTGTIGIMVSKNNNIIGIEINKYAVEDAKNNKKLNNIKNIEFLCGSAEKCINKLNFKPDIIIIDPPRSGLNKASSDDIKNLNPEKILYVSCDPMTLMRDLNLLSDQYEIIEITPFDMFPNTYHLENLCVLKKKSI